MSGKTKNGDGRLSLATRTSTLKRRSVDGRILFVVALPTCLVLGPLGTTSARGDAPNAGLPRAVPAEVLRRFTAETPEAMVETNTHRALDAKATEADVVASMAVIASLADRTRYGVAEHALNELAASPSLSPELRSEASALARQLAPDEGTVAGAAKAHAIGVVTDVSVLGPFRDTGGGLEAHDGPEQGKTAAAFVDSKAAYSWGTVEVAWREAPATFGQAHGLPLDLFVHPRKESCSFVASKITLGTAKTILVRLAASGTARLLFDGVDVASSDDVHGRARLDRLAAQVEATAGSHLLAAKVCTGALDDSGRVRLRLTDAMHAPVPFTASSHLELKAGEKISWGTAKSIKMTTPLLRAAAGKGSTDALLAAAIARTLGGADDLKSPRAAGQLDALLQVKELEADKVAMAAWVTPSGATKSGRLYRARIAAAKASDVATTAFVDRRLVEQHLATAMPDWALASFRGAKLESKKDDDAILLGARTRTGLRVEALSIEAMRDLEATFRAGPERVPTAMLFEFAGLARSHNPKAWITVSNELARRGLRGEVLVDAMSARGRDEVVKAAKDAFEGGMDDADEALSVANHVTEAGAHEVAASLYRTVTRWAPNRPEAWAGLARELEAAPFASKDKALALVALRRARELSPGDAKYRAELALRSGGTKTEPDSAKLNLEAGDDERWLTPTATILARRKGVPAKGPPDVADRELHWMRAVRMHADNRVSQLIQYAREIVIAPRTEQELFESIPPEGDLTEILRARVHKRAGGVLFPVEEHNDGARPRIRWPELEAGDTVEVIVRQWTSTAVGGRGDAPFYFMDYAGAPASHPLLYNEVIVESLPGHPLYVDVLHDTLAPHKRLEKDENGRHIVQLIWDKPLVIAEEPLVPQLSEVTPVIVGSTFKTWDQFRTWYAEAVRGFTEPDDEVRRLAAELTKGKKTRDDKLRALFEFVADDIRYVNYVSGEWWLPNRPQQLLARREGDCDDKAILLITLLRAVGIDAQEVMVQTRMTGQPSVLLSKNVAVPMFDHGIAFLPGPGGGRYLDATSPQSRLGPIPSMDARAVALRMDTGPAEIVRLPASSPADHGADVVWTLALNADGSGDVVGEERHTGDAAFWLRTNLTQAEARSQYVEDALVGPWLSTVEVDKAIDFQGDLASGQATVKYKAKSRGLARHEGRELVLSLSPSNTYGSALAPLETRTLPVQLPPHLAPSHQNRTLNVVAPAGFVWGELPPSGEAKGGPYGSARIDIARDARDPRTLVVKRSIVFDQHLIPVESYRSWRAWIANVDALMHKEVRLVPVGGGK